MGMWQIEMEPIKDWLDGLDKQTAYQVYADRTSNAPWWGKSRAPSSAP